MIKEYRAFTWYVTPQRLRDIADSLEKKWESTTLGGDLTGYTYQDWTAGIKIDFVVDQEAMGVRRR